MAGFEEAEVERAIADLERVGLLDDERFAAEFARTRARNRLDADRSVRSSLLAKGLAREVAERAVAGLGDEDERARALARKAASRAAGADPATAPRRLMEMLLRRGYPYETAHDAVRAVLAERGAPVPDEPA
jgi:regulatory protein